MKLKLFTTSLAILFSFSIMAQELAFKALASSGDNAIERASNPGEYEPIKLGTPIYKNDKIVVGAESYLGLTSKAGKTVQIKEEGIYAVNDLSGDLTADNSSVAQKYISYIFDEMSKGDESYGSNMSLTGSVERSLDNKGINVYLPQKTKILKDEAALVNWKAKEGVSSYKLVISNMFDEEVYTMQTKEKNAQLQFSKMELEPEEVYKLAVYDQDNKQIRSGIVTLHVPTKEEQQKIMKDFQAIEEATSEDDAISYLVRASFYEQNEMYLKAIENFEKAIALEPNVAEYKKLYENFKNKTGINGEL